MKNLLTIAASVAMLAVAVPFAANQWITFSVRNATWKESAELERLQNVQNIAYIQSQEEAAEQAANKQAWDQAAEEFYADSTAYMRSHNISWGSADWRLIHDYTTKRIGEVFDGSNNHPLPLYRGPRANPQPPAQAPRTLTDIQIRRWLVQGSGTVYTDEQLEAMTDAQLRAACTKH